MQTVNQPWSLSSEEVLKILNTKNSGLTEKEFESRLLKYGSNTFHEKENINVISIFLKQFVSPLIFLLIFAATITGILHHFIDTTVIAFAVLLNVCLGFYHEYHAENTLNQLKTYIKDRAMVIRNGREQEIDSSMFVPGDIIKLSYGTRIPADTRILSSNNFSVDEAILTGESMSIEKNEDVVSVASEVVDRKNIAHAGTLVVQGYATGVVYATGNKTEIGKIADIVSVIDRAKTPLQKGISNFAWFIFGLVILIVTIIFILGVYRGESFVDMFVLSVAVAVGAVPEALPIVLTVILAIGAERIASKKGIIRKLSSAETLGSTTLIMTDKTGTLTMADMKLIGIYTESDLVSKDLNVLEDGVFSHGQKKLLEIALLNTNISIENPDDNKEQWIFKGKPFETNIAKTCRVHNISLDNITSTSSFVVLPFNSTNKFSVAEKDGMYSVMGAPDILLKRSNISKEEYIKLENYIEVMSKEGKRLVGLAQFENKKNVKHLTPEDVINIDFLGMLAFYDPIRPEVPAAIKNIEAHGIKMVLVTGDLKGTAISIAKNLDWNVSEEEVLIGNEIRILSDEELIKIIPKIKIFARVTPEDKLRIGKLYQSLGEVVAMTGDGVNDAPALKAMDIGISLGSGSDVAKSAADLVLLDDNFQTISHAIDEGRRILSNVRKSFVYLMSNSFDEVFVIGGSLIMGLALPLTALQIIWVNLFTGSLPALAFAFDEDLDKHKFVSRKLNSVFTTEVKILTFGVGIISSAFLFLVYYFLLQTSIDISIIRSIFFVCFSSYILVVAFSFRSLYRPLFSYKTFSNKKLNISILIPAILLIITMTVPWVRNVFSIAPLPLYSIPFIILWLIFNVLLVEFAKYLMRFKAKMWHL